MKLVIATPLYPPEPGGPATYAKVLEEALSKRGWEVEVVKFSIVRGLPKLRRHFAYMRRVYRAAKDADAVLALDPVSVGFPAMLAARRAGKPFFVKIVGDYAWEQGTQRFGVTANLDEFVGLDGKRAPKTRLGVRLFQRVQRRVARAAKRIIVPSEYLKRVVTAWGIPAEKIAVVYNAGPRPETLSAETGFSKGIAGLSPGEKPVSAPYLITVARLVPWKGIETSIHALALLRARAETASLRYVVVGDGPQRASLEALVGDLGLEEAVIFTGAVPHDTALSHMRRAAAFVLPTLYEGLSHTILEAFVEGVPVVTTSVGGNPELVEDGMTGLMAPVGNPEALAEAIGRLLADAPLRVRIVAGARAKAAGMSRERMIEGTVIALSQ